jgi:16S rRNA (guanine1207-N2)-methyltransferase
LIVSRRKREEVPLSRRAVPDPLRGKVRPPVVVVLGSRAEVVNLLRGCDGPDATCYQMDLYQSERLREELGAANLAAQVVTLPDLWDLQADFQTAIYLPARAGERELKIDVVEQAFHVLKPGGALVVWSPQADDTFFAPLQTKIFGRVHEHRSEADAVFWSRREGDRPRRRHEVVFQAKIRDGRSCRFLSRPGTFSYGRFDNGARALTKVMEIAPGDRVLDLGCGCGTNGIFAAQIAGDTGHVVFIDSNVRATALAEHNARTNGVASFEVIASHRVEGPPGGSFDVALANPPYFAQHAITRLFVERSRDLLKPDGRFYMVTKQPSEVAAIVEEDFGHVEAVMQRGYTILMA